MRSSRDKYLHQDTLVVVAYLYNGSSGRVSEVSIKYKQNFVCDISNGK